MGFGGKTGKRGLSRERIVLEPLVNEVLGVKWKTYQTWCYRQGGKSLDVELFLKKFNNLYE